MIASLCDHSHTTTYPLNMINTDKLQLKIYLAIWRVIGWSMTQGIRNYRHPLNSHPIPRHPVNKASIERHLYSERHPERKTISYLEFIEMKWESSDSPVLSPGDTAYSLDLNHVPVHVLCCLCCHNLEVYGRMDGWMLMAWMLHLSSCFCFLVVFPFFSSLELVHWTDLQIPRLGSHYK